MTKEQAAAFRACDEAYSRAVAEHERAYAAAKTHSDYVRADENFARARRKWQDDLARATKGQF